MRLLSAAVLLLCFCGSGNSGKALAEQPAEPGDTLRADSPALAPAVQRLVSLFPGYSHTREFTEPFPYLSVHDSADVLLGYQCLSDLAGTTVQGYVDPVPVMVFTDPMGALLHYDVLGDVETPAYLQLVLCSDLEERLRAYRVGQEEPVDAVTLATCTSNAVIAAVTGTLDRLVKQVIAAEPR